MDIAHKLEQIGRDRHPNVCQAGIQYGTAGFRDRADRLDHVMFRVGALAVLRSKLMAGATIGVMITASHNPIEDNGVKLVDPKGDMMELKWEDLATQLANASDNEVRAVLEHIIQSTGIDLQRSACVFVGRDTRPSSPALCAAVLEGIEVAGGEARNFGVVSTPLLHYLVVCQNTNGAYGETSEEGYFNKLSKAFKQFNGQITSKGNYSPQLLFDGANGVGAEKMQKFAQNLKGYLNVDLLNDASLAEDVLNLDCGADFVKVNQKPPKKFEGFVEGQRCVSVDGDADRVIYFYTSDADGFVLLDGDKVATLIASYIKQLLSESGLDLEVGMVQTAYANGSSTRYISEQLRVTVACVPTGVKHLHHKAQDFDIGVYFEANGHGTAVYSPKAISMIEERAKQQCPAAERLKLLMDMTNQTVGDALSDLLLVESILHAKGWSAQDWSKAYTDAPSRLLKVKVQDRNLIRVEDADRVAASPPGLQSAINAAVANFAQGRSFVRPSGTEDVVRVYAEADTQQTADRLAYDVAQLVHSMAGGVGQPPAKP